MATSATEWIVSANSVGDPVTNQPKPLAAAIAVLVAMEIETEDDIDGASLARGAAIAAPRYSRICPLPSTTHFWLVRPSSPTGPRACSLLVEMPISAPEAVFEAVGKARRRIDHHRARIDLAQEAHRVGVIAR